MYEFREKELKNEVYHAVNYRVQGGQYDTTSKK